MALFVVIMAASLWVFTQRDPHKKPKVARSREHAPRISFEDFTVWKYEDKLLVASLTGRFANFVDPNSLELFGSIRGINQQGKKKQFFSAESATVHFAAKGVVDLVKNSRITKTEVENQVKFGYDDVILYTDYAKFFPGEDRLVSDLAVRIQGPDVEIRGEKGFEFFNKTGDLKVYGPLEGTLRSLPR